MEVNTLEKIIELTRENEDLRIENELLRKDNRLLKYAIKKLLERLKR
jgi:hypothetical protein